MVNIKRFFLFSAVLALSLVVSACGVENNPAAPLERLAADTVKQPELIDLTSIPQDLYCDQAVITGHTAFLYGTGDAGGSFLRVDLERDEATPIELPIGGSVFSLSVSPSGNCLAVIDSARSENDVVRDVFTLFEINADGAIVRQVELSGIRAVNLLAIGTPVVNGCALLDDVVFVIINNCLFFMDLSGGYITSVRWNGSHPRLACCLGDRVCVFDPDDRGGPCRSVRLSHEGRMLLEDIEIPDTAFGVIPSSGNETLFFAEDKTVFAFDIRTGRRTECWEFPYGFAAGKEYYYNGDAFLLERYHGKVQFYKIEQRG